MCAKARDDSERAEFTFRVLYRLMKDCPGWQVP